MEGALPSALDGIYVRNGPSPHPALPHTGDFHWYGPKLQRSCFPALLRASALGVPMSAMGRRTPACPQSTLYTADNAFFV